MLKIDTHIHSIASGHAFSTIYEIAREAQVRGLELIAITDHGPSMKGAPHAEYFNMGSRVPKRLFDIDILFGCEANIISDNGDIDLNDDIISGLDILLVGFHEFTGYLGGSKEKNTRVLMKAIEKNEIDIITHPYRPQFPICVEEIACIAAEKNVVLEINNAFLSSLFKNTDSDSIMEIKNMVKYIKKYDGKAIIGSDAHIQNEVGDDTYVKKMWDVLELEGLNILTDKNSLLHFINNKNKIKNI